MGIGRNIQHILVKKGIKAYKMAKEIGIGQGYIYDILNGKNKNPGVYTVKKIADYLGLTIDELLK